MRNKALLSLALSASLLLAQGLRAEPSAEPVPAVTSVATAVAVNDGKPLLGSSSTPVAATSLDGAKPVSAVDAPKKAQGSASSALDKGPVGISGGGLVSAIKSPTQASDKAESINLKKIKALNAKLATDQSALSNAQAAGDSVLILNSQSQLDKDNAALNSLQMRPTPTARTTPGK